MRNIILIGFMGSGKTSVGTKLAELSKMQFLDTDSRIEEEQGKCINDIFAEFGEELFRRLETQLLHQLLQEGDNRVIAVGGGLPVREENQKLIRQLGTVVYLKASKQSIMKRLYKDNTRPLLQGDNIEEKVEILMKNREHIYKKASNIIVETDDRNFQQICNDIRKQYLERK